MADQLRLHCYAAAFGHHFAEKKIRDYSEEHGVVLDPFAGSGTALLHSVLLRRRAIGIDVDPVACLIARVATTYYEIEKLESFRSRIRAEVERLILESRPACELKTRLRAGDEFRINGYYARIPMIPALDFWFAANHKHALAALVQVANRVRDVSLRNLFRLSISSAIIRKWPNTISQAMDVDHSRPHRVRPARIHIKSTYHQFLRVFDKTISTVRRISELMPSSSPTVGVFQGDATDRLRTLNASSVDFVFTSPPYVGAIDYPRAHKFAEWWLTSSPEELLCTANNYIGLRTPNDDWEIIENNCKKVLGSEIRDISWVKEKVPRQHARICQYVCDMHGIMIELKRVLRTGKPLVMVLGNNHLAGRTVPIVRLIASVAARAGFRCLDVRRRKIKGTRRRYPFGVKGFSGPMTCEYVIEGKA